MQHQEHNSLSLMVLGMHRSGTSALTGALAKLGAYPGPILVPGIADVNAKGFWEHPGIVDIHERLLDSLHTSWEDVGSLPPEWWLNPAVDGFADEIKGLLERDYAGHPLWVIKDPRMCRLLPLWDRVLAEIDVEPRYLIVLRNPLEVAASLQKRDGLSLAHGCLLWLNHILTAEEATRGGVRTFIDYEELLANWHAVMLRVTRSLCLELALDSQEASREVDTFLDPALKHQRGHDASDSMDHPAIRYARDFYRQLAACESDDARIAAVGGYSREVRNLMRLVGPWSDTIVPLRREIAQLRIEVAVQSRRAVGYKQEVARVKGTLSWHITAPLRVIQNGIRNIFGKIKSGE